MRLECISIKRFRSISLCELPSCGGFNVLIGKNNSGKSNILSSIDNFFSCIGDGQVVKLDPPIGREIDFFCKDTRKPIEIILTFSLTLAERDELLRDIVTEAPQLSHAIDGLDPTLRLQATLAIYPPPSSFAVVGKIALVPVAVESNTSEMKERVLLLINREAGIEIRNRLDTIRNKTRRIEAFNKLASDIDEDDWRRMKEDKQNVPPQVFLRHYVTRSEIGLEFAGTIGTIVKEASNYHDFKQTIESIINSESSEIESAQKQPLKNIIETFAGEQYSTPEYALRLLSRLAEIKVLYLKERREQIGREEAKRLLDLKVRRGGDETLNNIKETVSALLGVKIDAFQGEREPRRGEQIAELDVDDFLVEMNGSGIREALRLLLDVEFDQPTILLVEEPELHLHPALETSMMRYLKRISGKGQVFISTHSTNFLDTAEMENVYLISKLKPDSTQAQLLNFEEAQIYLPKELGIRLSSLFMYDRLVFVEGASDEDIIREWASTLGVNLSQVNVGFIPMGGVRNFTHFATAFTIDFLTRRQVKLWFLMDRDEKNDDEVQRLIGSFGNKAQVVILERRELENYLICPRAILAFIKEKWEVSGVKGSLPTEADIFQTIDEVAEQLKQLAIDKRVAKLTAMPSYPSSDIFKESESTTIVDRISSDIQNRRDELEKFFHKMDSIYEEQKKHVDSVWGSKKLSIIPGDILIDQVCKKYHVRYYKERDSSNLSSLMQKSEIDSQLDTFISQIGTQM
jgi:predicted ATP-dependent endonuclease of OLD family